MTYNFQNTIINKYKTIRTLKKKNLSKQKAMFHDLELEVIWKLNKQITLVVVKQQST